MAAPIIVIIAAVLCGVLSSVIYALNERTLQEARNRTNRMAEDCDEMAQLIQEIGDTNDALADGLLKLSASFGVSCADMVQNMNRNLRNLITESTKSVDAVLYNCPNCGAPVRGGECEYCGTVFTRSNDEMRSYPLPPHWMDWREYHERIDPGRTIRFYNPETHTWEWVGEDAMKQVVMRNGRRN